MRKKVTGLVWALLLCHSATLFAAAAPAAPAKKETITNGDCLDCHSDAQVRKVNGKDVPLPAFDTNRFNASIHGKLQCVECHNGIKEAVHESHPPPPQCVECHPSQASHTNALYTYLASAHGQSRSSGVAVAATCNDCHGSHAVEPVKNNTSPLSKMNLSQTCAKCHAKENAIFLRSIHGQLLAKGDKHAPSCTDCHQGHTIESTKKAHFKRTSDQKCGNCHQDRLEHYHETYHGKALVLGRPSVVPEVAACYDCHGHHDVLPTSNPASHLSATNRLATCRQCHESATEKFAQYMPHANPLDREHYPILNATFILMTSLLMGVFTFFGAHTLFWLITSVSIYLRDPAAAKALKIKNEKGDEWFVRFTPFQRFLHFLVVTSFLILVITGMPLKFYDAHWAKVLFGLVGGLEAARGLHRVAAMITFLYFFLHVFNLIVVLWGKRDAVKDPATGSYSIKRMLMAMFGPDSMIPSWRDVQDFIAHCKWFMGKGPKPQWDRWTYWERFDYFAVFWGVAIIGSSGMIMWFPEFFTRFLPGWLINVSLIVHSDEALLAAGFIFSIHFFNTHFRLEKFPMDTVIFTGRISAAELAHERQLWRDRLQAKKELEQLRAKDEWERWKKINKPIGFVFFGVGLILLVLIMYAMSSRLLHWH